MEKNKELGLLAPLELMLQWNHHCDANGKDADCILLNEDRTYVEAFDNEELAMKEIINSDSPEFKRNDGFLVNVWNDDGTYKGMLYVPEPEIWNYIDFEKD